MDALTPTEIEAAVAVLKRERVADENTRYPMVTLAELPKAEVLGWKPGQPFRRFALVVLYRQGRTSEALVDLNGQKVAWSVERPGVHPSIMQEEWDRARAATLADAKWRAAMAKRGYRDFRNVDCTPLPAGPFRNEAYGSRRILKVPCYDTSNQLHPLVGRPIEGVTAVVDVTAGEVIDVVDSGLVVALQPPPQAYGRDWPAPRPPALPVGIVAPQGSNIRLSGAVEIAWHDWSFHLRADRRAGMVLSLVRFADGAERRLIAYQLSVAELFVPYMDPDPAWGYRTHVDAGELGLGYLISSLERGRDCPHQAAYVDLLYPSDKGGVFKAPRAVCLFERATGDPAWRHYDADAERADSRPEIELVARMIPTIGNYDYVIDYVFQNRGDITIRVGATGIDAVRSAAAADLEAPSAKAETAHGALVAPFTVAPYHDHYVSFRLDLDIDGQENSFIADTFVLERLQPPNPRRSIWRLASERLEREGAITANHAGAVWRIVNEKRKNRLKYATGYEIAQGHMVQSTLAEDDSAQARAAFSKNPLWVTVYDPRQRWAAGDYPNQSVKAEGLSTYVADGASAANADLVAWYTLGFRHVTRAEDFPVLPTRWHQFTLRPIHFFDRDPSGNLNPSFAPKAPSQ
jgi:primary-amine oxidase